MFFVVVIFATSLSLAIFSWESSLRVSVLFSFPLLTIIIFLSAWIGISVFFFVVIFAISLSLSIFSLRLSVLFSLELLTKHGKACILVWVNIITMFCTHSSAG